MPDVFPSHSLPAAVAHPHSSNSTDASACDTTAPPARVVIDTNLVLDLLLFADPAVAALHQALRDGQLHWIGTAHMRNELERVLAYPQIAPRLHYWGRSAADVLQQRDTLCQPCAPAPRCTFICKDPDDQCFIDLAVAHHACLLSKDKLVLRLRKRLARAGIAVSTRWPITVT